MTENRVRRAVLEAGVLEVGEFSFAADGGDSKKANNKLNFDRLHEHPEQLKIVAHDLARVVFRFRPDALLGIVQGGEDLAEVINEDPEFPALPIIKVDKDEENSVAGRKKFKFRSEEQREILQSAESIVIVEDVFNKFASTKGILAMDGVQEKTTAVVAVWDRGFHPSRPGLVVHAEALVQEYIPRKLNERDMLLYDVAPDYSD